MIQLEAINAKFVLLNSQHYVQISFRFNIVRSGKFVILKYGE